MQPLPRESLTHTGHQLEPTPPDDEGTSADGAYSKTSLAFQVYPHCHPFKLPTIKYTRSNCPVLLPEHIPT